MKNSLKILVGIVFCLSLFGSVKAQDNATYVEEVTVQDSTYVDDLFMEEEEEAGKGNNTVLYIVGAVVVIGAGVVLMRKKKK